MSNSLFQQAYCIQASFFLNKYANHILFTKSNIDYFITSFHNSWVEWGIIFLLAITVGLWKVSHQKLMK